MGPIRLLVGYEEVSDPHVLKVHFFPRGLQRRCPQGTWLQPRACRRAATAPLPAGPTEKAWVPWALKGSLPSAQHPVCGLCLQPCLNPPAHCPAPGRKEGSAADRAAQGHGSSWLPPFTTTLRTLHMFCWPNCALRSWCRLLCVPRGAAEEPGDFWWAVWSSRYPRLWLNRTLLGQLCLRRQWWQNPDSMVAFQDGRSMGFSTQLSPKMLQMDSFFSLKRGLSGICDLFWWRDPCVGLGKASDRKETDQLFTWGEEGLSVQTALDSRGHLSWPALPSRGFLVFT